MRKILAFLFLSIFMISFVSAYMPETHTYINDKALLKASDTEYGKVVSQYYDDFIACDILTDISVFYYFEEGVNAIGTKYKQTHTQNLCKKMVENAENDRQLACAIGVCAHHVQDGIAHNKFVPLVIERTKLVNGLVHIFAEERVNDELRNRELTDKTRQALRNVAPIHKEFFRENLVSEGVDFPFDSMYDAFVDEVVGSEKYSVGFRGFLAVPLTIHFILFLIFGLSLMFFAFLFRRSNKTIFNYIGLFLTSFMALLIILVYILFFTGKLWVFFQTVSTPITWLMPVQGWESYINEAIKETSNMMSSGAGYVMAVTPDPAGEKALIKAGESGSTVRIIIDILIIVLIGLFVYLNIRRKKKKRN